MSTEQTRPVLPWSHPEHDRADHRVDRRHRHAGQEHDHQGRPDSRTAGVPDHGDAEQQQAECVGAGQVRPAADHAGEQRPDDAAQAERGGQGTQPGGAYAEVGDDEEHVEGVERRRSHGHQAGGEQHRHQYPVGHVEPHAVAELRPKPGLRGRRTGYLRGLNGSHREERRHERERVEQQRPLHAEGDQQRRGERRPDHGGGALGGLADTAGPGPLLSGDQVADEGKPGPVEQLRADAGRRDHQVDQGELDADAHGAGRQQGHPEQYRDQRTTQYVGGEHGALQVPPVHEDPGHRAEHDAGQGHRDEYAGGCQGCPGVAVGDAGTDPEQQVVSKIASPSSEISEPSHSFAYSRLINSRVTIAGVSQCGSDPTSR